jgi:hypothetical protein
MTLLLLECMQMTETATVPTFSAHELAAATTDAYAFSYYGRKQWFACALLLATRGYNQPQATAILYSKIMRLAADERLHPDRKATSDDLLRFLELPGTAEYLAENLDEYVLNIIGEDLLTAEPVKQRSRDALRLVWSR